MAKGRTGPGPGYDGPEYDPVYGPPLDPGIGEPVSPRLLRRTRPGGGRMLPFLVAGAAVLAVVAATVVVLVVRGGEEPMAQPTPVPTDEPKGQAARLVEVLTADGFRCAAQFGGADGSRRGCFVTRADTILTSAIFEDDANGGVVAVRLTARDLSRSSALATRTVEVVSNLVELFGPVFPDDQARIAAMLRKPAVKAKGAWGNYLTSNRGGTVELRADKDGRAPLLPVQPVLSTPRTVVVSALTSTGWRCAASCTKAGQWVATDVRIEGADRITGIRMTVTGTGPLETTRDGFHAQVRNLFGLLDGEGVPELKAWLDDQRDRGSGSAYVSGWRISVEARYSGERPAGYDLRLSTEPRLTAVQ